MENGEMYRILIVDDNRNNLFTLRELVKEYIDAEVLEADSGENALKILNGQIVDLIILDVCMNGMDGFQLASLIKQRKKTRDIPIVFLTAAYITDDFKKRGFEIGAVDYLTKPIDEYQLINRINIYLKLIEKERSMNKILEQRIYEKTEELIKAKKEAVAANEAKSIFMANISHELRTPLNIILSSTQLIRSYLDSDIALDKKKLREKIDMQTQNCYRLLRLINNLIDITKIDTGNINLIFKPCNIVKIVEDITLSVAEYARTKGIEIIFDTDVEEKFVQCDFDAMERIILNLLSNAIKFTPKGGSIFVTVKDLDKHVRISIKDTGIGIEENKFDIIFERFRQVDNLLTRGNEGSGIGLSLVKALVEMHQGQIYVKSKYNYGSEFIVELPCDNNLHYDENLTNNSSSIQNNNVIKKVNIEFSDIYF